MPDQSPITRGWVPETATHVPETAATDANVETKPDAPPGMTFRNYDLLSEIGRGGMGVVFKARQKLTDRVVALKVIRGRLGVSDHSKARFTAEARALARVTHPHIVSVFEVGEEDECPFFTMEFIDGESLARRSSTGPMTPDEAADLIEKLAGAVQTAHDVGVLHRDIKPANVLLGANGEVKLTDFGLAKHLDRTDGLTADGSALGTPSYMPPEQASGDLAHCGPAADIYSLGATLYELLTGRPPFLGDTAAATLLRVLRDDVVPPRKLRPDIPPELEAICLKCLEKSTANRYATAAALAEDLARWRTGLSTVARPLSSPRRAWRRLRRNWRPVTLSALVVVGLAVAAIIGARTLTPDPPPDPVLGIEAALRRGEAVELIGPKGEPQRKRWVTGVGEAVAVPNGPFLVSSSGQADLELVSDSQSGRYRLSAEFQSESSTKPLSHGGLYFARRAGIENADGVAHRIGRVCYHDDLFRNDSETDTFVAVQYGWLTNTADSPFCCALASLASRPVTERKVLPRPWRRVEIEVTPEGIQARWRRAPGEPMVEIRPGGMPLSVISRQVAAQHVNLLENLRQKNVRLDLTDPHYDPRGGVGLYVLNGSVYFRNVVIEPLPHPNP